MPGCEVVIGRRDQLVRVRVAPWRRETDCAYPEDNRKQKARRSHRGRPAALRFATPKACLLGCEDEFVPGYDIVVRNTRAVNSSNAPDALTKASGKWAPASGVASVGVPLAAAAATNSVNRLLRFFRAAMVE